MNTKNWDEMNAVEKTKAALADCLTSLESGGECKVTCAKEAREALSLATQEPTTEEMEFRAKFRNPDLENRASELHLAVMLYARRPVREYLAACDAAILQKIGRALATLAVKECNTGLSEADERRREKLAAQAATVAGWYGLTVTAHGDPRGYVLRLHGEGVVANGWGEWFGVA